MPDAAWCLKSRTGSHMTGWWFERFVSLKMVCQLPIIAISMDGKGYYIYCIYTVYIYIWIVIIDITYIYIYILNSYLLLIVIVHLCPSCPRWSISINLPTHWVAGQRGLGRHDDFNLLAWYCKLVSKCSLGFWGVWIWFWAIPTSSESQNNCQHCMLHLIHIYLANRTKRPCLTLSDISRHGTALLGMIYCFGCRLTMLHRPPIFAIDHHLYPYLFYPQYM